MTIEHRLISLGDIHGVVNWVAADQAARLAIVPVATDVYKVCLQTDESGLYVLRTHSPVAWQKINSAANIASITLSATGTLTVTLDDATVFAVSGILVDGEIDVADFGVVERDINDLVIRKAAFNIAAITSGNTRTITVQDWDHVLGAVPAFVGDKAYAAGTLVREAGAVYFATAAFTAGPAFVPGDWTKLALAADVVDYSGDIAAIEADILVLETAVAAMPLVALEDSPVRGVATAVGAATLAIGFGADATATLATSVGVHSTAAGSGVALGYNATALASSVAVGRVATNTNTFSVAVGDAAQSASVAVAVGPSANVSAANSVGVGASATVSAQYAVAIGRNAVTAGLNGVTVGGAANTTSYGARGQSSVVIGYNASNASGNNHVAVGPESSVIGAGTRPNIAVGYQARSSGDGCIIIGQSIANSSNANLILIGNQFGSAHIASTLAIGQNIETGGNGGGIYIGSGLAGLNSTSSDSLPNILIARNVTVPNSTYNAVVLAPNGFAHTTKTVSNSVSAPVHRRNAGGHANIAYRDWQSMVEETTNATTQQMSQYRVGVDYLNHVPAAHLCSFHGHILARQTGGAAGTVGDSHVFEVKGVLKFDGAAYTTMVSTITTLANDAAAAAWTVAVYTSASGWSFDVTGEANKNITWVANIQVTQLFA